MEHNEQFIPDESGWNDQPDDEGEELGYHGLTAVVLLGCVGNLDTNAPGKSAFRGNSESDLRALVRKARQVEAEARTLPPGERVGKMKEALPPEGMGELLGCSPRGENRLSLQEEILEYMSPIYGDFTLEVDMPTVAAYRRKNPECSIREALLEGWKAYKEKEEKWNKERASNGSSYRSVSDQAVKDSAEVEHAKLVSAKRAKKTDKEAIIESRKEGLEFRKWVHANAEAHIRFRSSWYYTDERKVERASGRMGVTRDRKRRWVEPPVPFEYAEPVVIEDEGVQIDSTMTRCEAEDMNYLDWWESYQVEEYPRREQADDSMKEYRERSAQARVERFLVWLDYIGQVGKETVSRVFNRDSETPEKSGKFYHTLSEENSKRTREDPWLTSAQVFMLSCAARIKTGYFLSKKQKEVINTMYHNPMNSRTFEVWETMGYKVG